MPIFMDRHDVRDMTAEAIAAAHRRDLEVQDKYGVKYMTYWFDQDRGTGFCLVDAPDAATATQVHREAHGEIPSDIIAVDLAAVEAFLGRISHPHDGAAGAAPEVDAGLRAVMFTDIVGSTEMTTRLGDAAALELVRYHGAKDQQEINALPAKYRSARCERAAIPNSCIHRSSKPMGGCHPPAAAAQLF